ncbi:MAG: plasmid pRiA4b ORF-3 family protein [Pseudomonadota bacterium]
MAKTTNPKSLPRTRSGGGVSTTIVGLKVTLRGTKPPVWRRLLMPGGMTLGDLHQAIQASMGWEDCHLHAFDIDGRQYGHRHTVDDVADEERLTLNGLLKSGVTRFAYTYDFSDKWEHSVVIERNRPPLDTSRYPVCIAGKRNCPPEDCGGPWGYQHLLAVLADPTHPEHTDQREWIGEEFGPDEFAVEIADATLAARFHRT